MEEQGPTEKAYRQWIRGMEPLTPEQKTKAEGIFVLARMMDAFAKMGSESSAAATIHRELRTASDKFRDVVRLTDTDLAEKPVAPIQSVRDELASRRRGKETA